MKHAVVAIVALLLSSCAGRSLALRVGDRALCKEHASPQRMEYLCVHGVVAPERCQMLGLTSPGLVLQVFPGESVTEDVQMVYVCYDEVTK